MRLKGRKPRNPASFMNNKMRGGKGVKGRTHMHGRKGRKR